MLADLLKWLENYRDLLEWAFYGSLAISLLSLIVIPWIVIYLPADYFLRYEPGPKREHFVLRCGYLLWRAGKNLIGITLVLLGFLLLFLPGQGLLTILIGTMLLDGPYKRESIHWIVSRRGVLHSLNWVRLRANRPPLLIAHGEIAQAGDQRL